MPLIEELPVTTTHRTSHGWAYVPDIKPQQQPLQKKRGAAKIHAAAKGDISAKQQKVIQSRLNDLDKENYKDTTIPIPAKSKEKAGRRVTPNVRRILTYQRTFAHYLADEEAQLAQSGNATTVPTLLPQTPTVGRSSSLRGTNTKQTPMQPPPRPGSAKRTPATATATPTPNVKRERSSSISISTAPSAPSTPQTQTQSQPMDLDHPTTSNKNTTTTTPINPLLLPSNLNLKAPSPSVLSHLLSEPPLSYSASRAQPLKDQPPHTNNSRLLNPHPPRHFCSICGYWGKVRCVRCGERTCGLMECWRGHEGACSVPAY